MIKKIFIKINSVFTLLMLLFFSAMPNAYAEEFTVSNNGEGSQSQIQIQQSSSTTVTQNNEANVNNDVNANSNTGENSASANNNGDISTTTGDVTQDISVSNQLNNSSVTTACCPDGGDTKATINGNGQDSTNNIVLSNTSQNNITINQNANISNNITGTASTGNNHADNNNNGDVSITTGNINASGTIRNIANIAEATGGTGEGNGDVQIIISGNAQGSINNALVGFNNNSSIIINNNSRLANVLSWNLNTGGNTASGNNNGKVFIKTGDIFLTLLIENILDISKAKIDCCPRENPPPPPPPPPPSPPPSGGDNPCRENCGGSNNPPCRENCGGSAGGGDPPGSGGSVLGTTLPATGNNTFAAMTLIAILMIAWGIYLRNKGYQKPSFTLRFRYNTLRLV